MKWLIAILIFVGVFLLSFSYGNDRISPDGMYFLYDDLLISQEKDKNKWYEDFDKDFELSWNVLGFDPSHISLKKNPGSLTLTSQRGSFETIFNDYKNIFLFDFPAQESDDFVLTTCISNFKPSEVWNQAGLVIWNDKDNYFKFVYEYGRDAPGGEGLVFTAGKEIGGRATYAWFEAEQTPRKMWLRIIKSGDTYELYNSTDGKIFNPVKLNKTSVLTEDNKVPSLTVPIKSIGIFTSNYTSETVPEVDASFDYFEFKLSTEQTDMPDY